MEHDWENFPNWIEDSKFAPYRCKVCGQQCFYDGESNFDRSVFLGECTGSKQEPKQETWRDRSPLL